MKYYNVTFKFTIPVAVSDEDEEVDAYYEARKRFNEFSVNEADVKIETTTENDYNNKRETINKLHGN